MHKNYSAGIDPTEDRIPSHMGNYDKRKNATQKSTKSNSFVGSKASDGSEINLTNLLATAHLAMAQQKGMHTGMMDSSFLGNDSTGTGKKKSASKVTKKYQKVSSISKPGHKRTQSDNPVAAGGGVKKINKENNYMYNLSIPEH